MKNYTPSKVIATATLSMALGLTAAVRAQNVTYELAPSAFTLALVVKQTAPGTFVRNPVGGAFAPGRTPAFRNDWATGRIVVEEGVPSITRLDTASSEYISKIVATRYGNRELINELIAAQIIPGPAGGWSLVYVYGDPMLGDDATDPVLTARKSGQRDVALDIIKIQYAGSAFAQNLLNSVSFRRDQQGEITSAVATLRGRYNYERSASIAFGGEGTSKAQVSGLEVGAASYFSYYSDPADRSEADYFIVPGAIRFNNLVGTTDVGGDNGEDEFGPGVVAGGASIGASRVITRRN